MTTDDLSDLTLVDAAARIAAGELTPLDLVGACVARVERVEPTVRAFAELDLDRALSTAAALTEELATTGPRGPLHGVPVGIKDVMDVEGLRTRAGSDVLADAAPADADAPAVARLREAGAVFVGKTTTHEFAFGVDTPPTRNPWDRDRIAGGSSGGSAAALAARECLGALGTDSGGSVRIPSAFCGTTGLRPRMGIVPLDRTVPFSWTHDTCGPMARTAADVALLWQVVAGGPCVVPSRLDEVSVAALDDISSVLADVDPDVDEAVQQATEVLVASGARRVAADLPRFDEWDQDRFAVVLSDLLAAHVDAGWYPSRADRYGPDLRAYLVRAEQVRGADLVLSRRRLDRLADRFRAVLDAADVLVMPTAVTVAPPAKPGDGREGVPDEGPRVSPLIARLIRSCAPISYCKLAAVSVPCGRSREGLPIGLQIVGRDEAAVLGVALAFQERTEHHLTAPPLVGQRV